MQKRWKGLAVLMILCLMCGCQRTEKTAYRTGQEVSEENRKAWEKAKTTPYGAYPELVTYTLGQMSGANDSNLPEGNTYEDNAYTRYLRKMLNIQNDTIYMESEDRYDEVVNIIAKDRTLPDVLVVSDRETLKELVENDLVEDLTEVFENCTSPRIKEMYESYGGDLLDAGRFDGKLMAIPETVIDHGPCLMWLRKDWMEELGLEEPKTLEDDLSVIQIWWEAPVPVTPWIRCLTALGPIPSAG